MRSVEAALRRSGGVVFSGGDFERWDLHVRGGMLGSMRMRMAVEEHGGGRQLLRIRSWPRFSRIGARRRARRSRALAAGAALAGAWIVAAVMAFVVAVIVACVVKDCATAAGVLTTALEPRPRGTAGVRAGRRSPPSR